MFGEQYNDLMADRKAVRTVLLVCMGIQAHISAKPVDRTEQVKKFEKGAAKWAETDNISLPEDLMSFLKDC